MARAPRLARPYVEGELLVKFHGTVEAMQRQNSHHLLGAQVIGQFKASPGLQHVRLPPGVSVEQALERYRADPRVTFAQPNHLYQFYALPEDPRFIELWGLNNTGQTLGAVDADINAPEAWALTPGAQAGVVAVIDSGVDFTHPDLAESMWVNPGEIPGNNKDDDGNGYVDDVHGIDAATVGQQPVDRIGHGTHVAGTIAARAGNGLGVVGVSPKTKLIACKIADAFGELTDTAAIRCLDYLLALKTRATHPVNIIASNNSWGGSLSSEALQEAIARSLQAGILFVAAAGNSGSDLTLSSAYPAEYEVPNVLSVGATDASDQWARFSNFGRQTVDVWAPGVSILSTVPRGEHGVSDGTSMAAPHVTGLVALLHAQDPARDWRALRNLVLSGGQEVSALSGRSLTGRRIRAADTGGVGSLTCVDQVVRGRLQPQGAVVTPSSGEPVTLSAVHIRCAQPNGAVTVSLSTAPGTVALADDGQGADRAAGDGIYTAEWTPPADEIVTLTFPGGDTVTVYPSSPLWPPLISEASATWDNEQGQSPSASFFVKFDTRGSQAPWEVQWDLDYDGRFNVDGTKAVDPVNGSSTLDTLLLLTPPSAETALAAVRVVDGAGHASEIQQVPTSYFPPYPKDLQLHTDVVLPRLNHPTPFFGIFYSTDLGPWTLEWDFDYDGQTFVPTAQEPLTRPRGDLDEIRGFIRSHTFSRLGPQRVAMRVIDSRKHASPLQTWGGAIQCGPPFVGGVSVEPSGQQEPVTVRLSAQAVAGCAPIQAYHWDFDGDGHFDETTSEPTVTHVYSDNPPRRLYWSGSVRVDSADGSNPSTFQLLVQNAAPHLEPVPEQRVSSMKRMTYQVQASDPAGQADTLRFSLMGAPAWATVGPTGELAWQAPSSWLHGEAPVTFELRVEDGEGGDSSVSVTLVPEPEAVQQTPVRQGCSSAGSPPSLPIMLLGALLLLLRNSALLIRRKETER